jgi:hypothetical protein
MIKAPEHPFPTPTTKIIFNLESRHENFLLGMEWESYH